jgi:HCO3- transporter family
MRNPLQEYYPPPVERNCTNSNGSESAVNVNASELLAWTHFNISIIEPEFDNNSCATTPFSKMYGQPNTALLSVILTGGTFLLAFSLKKFRNSKFLGRSVSILSCEFVTSTCAQVHRCFVYYCAILQIHTIIKKVFGWHSLAKRV